MQALGRNAQIALAALTLGTLVSAIAMPGEVSPAADLEGMTTLDLKSGEVTHCDFNKPRSAAEKAKSAQDVKVKFVKLTLDSCVWGDARASQADGAWSVYRNGADVACVLEVSSAPGIADPGPGAYLNFLRGKGIGDARSLTDDESRFDNKRWRHEVVQSTVPSSSPAAGRTMHEAAIWAWYGADRLATFTCFGPMAAMQENVSEVQAIASTLRILTSE